MKQTHGVFVISLDFEMMWGGIDHNTIESYGENIAGVWKAVPCLLSMFERYDIHATWGCVGLLARNNVKELIDNRPEILPNYKDRNLSTYNHYEEIKNDQKEYFLHRS